VTSVSPGSLPISILKEGVEGLEEVVVVMEVVVIVLSS